MGQTRISNGDHDFIIKSRNHKGNRTKKSFQKGLKRNRQNEKQVLSSEFIDLGGKNNARIFSFPHMTGAALAHQVRTLSQPFNVKQNGDNNEIPDSSLAKTKMEEFAKSFLATVPNKFLKALLKASGLESNFPRLNGERKKLIENFFRPLKNTFLPNNENPHKLSDDQKYVLSRFKEEKTIRRSPDKRNLLSAGVSDKVLSRIKSTWQSPDHALAA